MAVCIDDLVEQMEMITEEYNTYLHVKTGELISVRMQYQNVAKKLAAGEEPPAGFDEGEKKEIAFAAEIDKHWQEYVKLPDQYEIHEYSIMRDFVEEVQDANKRETLYRAISGTQAFHIFKDRVRDLQLEKAWSAFKRCRYYKIAEEWCEIYNIEYGEKE